MSPILSTEPAAGWASTKENPRLPYATGSTGLALTVRGSSRRIMIMRFRPANIRLINRRSLLPRLLLALSSRRGDDDVKNTPRSVVLTRSLHIRSNRSSTDSSQRGGPLSGFLVYGRLLGSLALLFSVWSAFQKFRPGSTNVPGCRSLGNHALGSNSPGADPAFSTGRTA